MSNVPANELLTHARSSLRKTTVRVTDNMGKTHCETIGPDGIVVTSVDSESPHKDFFIANSSKDGTYAQLKPYLYLGSEDLSRDLEKLKTVGITHIVNLATYCPNSFPDEFKYLKISIFDMPEKDIKQHFPEIIEFIEDARKSGGACFVHCNAGISRAPTSCMAYLMWKDKVKRITAYDYVRQRRWVFPNAGFMEQLNVYEIELKLKDSQNTIDPEL